MPDPKPTVGRIVHWYRRVPGLGEAAPVEGPLAAMIVGMPAIREPGDPIWLRVFIPESTVRDVSTQASYDSCDPPIAGTWRWPPRV